MSILKKNKNHQSGGFLCVFTCLSVYLPMIDLITYPPIISPAIAGG